MNDTDFPKVTPPLRIVAPEDKPFWDAIDAGYLVIARCPCGACYTRLQACLCCLEPAESLQWIAASGQGVVRTFIVFEKAYHPYFADAVPYVVAMVALAEGPDLLTNVVDAELSGMTIGMPVRIVIRNVRNQRLHQAIPTRSSATSIPSEDYVRE